MPGVPGCSTISGQILQQASMLFWPLWPTILCAWKYVSCVMLCCTDKNKAETDDIWLTEWEAPQWPMTARLRASTIYVLQLLSTPYMLIYTTASQSWINKWVQMVNYICTSNFLEWHRKHSCSTCTANFPTKTATDTGASESKFKLRYHGRVVYPNCMHTAFNGMYAAAVRTTRKKQKYEIWNAAIGSLWFSSVRNEV